MNQRTKKTQVKEKQTKFINENCFISSENWNFWEKCKYPVKTGHFRTLNFAENCEFWGSKSENLYF